MTACDHSELTKICLRYGAESYFLKEMKEDRDSIEYFRFFKNLILDLSPYDTKERQIWREFAQFEKAIIKMDTDYGTEVGQYFKKAYYLLTLNEEHLLPSRLLIPSWVQKSNPGVSSKYDGAVFNISMAADQLFVAKLIIDKKCTTYEEANESLYRGDKNIKFPSFRKRAEHAGINLKDIKTLGIKSDVRHAYMYKMKRPLPKSRRFHAWKNS